MRINIDRGATEPLFRQIGRALSATVSAGGLRAGEKLPSARELAADLKVNRLTVESAYAELEAAGVIERRKGSGTYVLPDFRAVEGADRPRSELASWQRRLPIAVPVVELEGCIFDFSVGTGAPDLVPLHSFGRILRRLAGRISRREAGYGNPKGELALRSSVAEILTAQGMPAKSRDVLITAGSQQAIALAVQALTRVGDKVLVEEPGYSAAVHLIRLLDRVPVGVPMDGEGMRIDALEAALRRPRVRLIYTMPTFHNPTGVCLSLSRRRRLLALATRHDVPVLEDDYVGDLRFEGEALPCLKTLDEVGGVIYVSTFSKMLMPGLRLGFLHAEGPVLEHLTRWKAALEIAGPTLQQSLLRGYLSVGLYRRHLRHCRQLYRKRRDAMAMAVRREFPRGTRFATPRGGLFLWVRLPAGLRCQELETAAAGAGVRIAGGRHFFVSDRGGDAWMRLNYAAMDAADIDEGLRRLGRVMTMTLGRQSARTRARSAQL